MTYATGDLRVRRNTETGESGVQHNPTRLRDDTEEGLFCQLVRRRRKSEGS